MDDLSAWIKDAIGLDPAYQGRVAFSLAVVILIWLIRQLLMMVVRRKNSDVRVLYRWRKTSNYVAVGLIFIIIVWVWFEGIRHISTFVGLISAALTIALQTPIVNLAGWAFILWRKPLEVGDRIQVGDIRGDVIDQRIFMFTMMEVGNWVDADQSTGRVIHVPNGKIFSEPLANYSQGFQYIWNEIPVLVTFESDWRKAKEILLKIAQEHAGERDAAAEEKVQEAARRYMIFYSKLTPTVYTTVRDSGILLTIRYLSEPRRRRALEQSIWEDILDAYAEHDDIDFAYPTQRFYNNATEGKEGTKPKPPAENK